MLLKLLWPFTATDVSAVVSLPQDQQKLYIWRSVGGIWYLHQQQKVTSRDVRVCVGVMVGTYRGERMPSVALEVLGVLVKLGILYEDEKMGEAKNGDIQEEGDVKEGEVIRANGEIQMVETL
jgi:hypothetical protein